MGARIGIIGAGQVGAAAGYLLSATPGISQVILVDQNIARAAGEAADIGHAAAFGTAARVSEGDYADLAGASVVVITAGASLKPGQTRLELLQQNLKMTDTIIGQILKVAPDAVLLFATNPVDVMPAIAVHRYGLPPGRAIGT
ncbi:MAG: lactate dehydrogenase, partial [Comamonas sp.]